MTACDELPADQGSAVLPAVSMEARAFGTLLRHHRRAAGLTQEELADRSGISVRAIADAESGRTIRPHRRSVQLMAEALHLTGAELAAFCAAGRHAGAAGERTQVAGASPGSASGDRQGSDAPPSSSARGESGTTVPRQLPGAVADFTGRAAEIAAMTGLLDQANAQPAGTVLISAIGGTAGVGKTALAVHWAHQVAGQFPDGQLHVNLRGYDPGPPVTAMDALAGFLSALGVPGQEIPPEEEQRAAHYRSLLAGKRMLILLDNAATVDQVRPLLPGPDCLVLLTSRDSLPGLVARDGARRLDLGPLPLDDAVALLVRLIGQPAEADPDAVAELARQCAQLPLALRIAAELSSARSSVRLADLVAELRDEQHRLDLLHADGDAHTAVRAVFSWSYDHLEAESAHAFRFAGLQPGPDLDAYALAALTGSKLEKARHVLGSLSRAHLIEPTTPARYSMHDLLRAYARDLVATCDHAQEQAQALTRLFDFYLHTAAAAMDVLYPAERTGRLPLAPTTVPIPGFASSASALAWLDTERSNLVAAAAQSANGDQPGYAAALSAILFRYLDARGHLPEAMAIHTHARDAARQAGDHAAEATALTGLGATYWRQGSYHQADQHYRQALVLQREADDQAGQARVLHNLGLIRNQQGSLKQAAKYQRQALAIFRQLGHQTGQAAALNSLGLIESSLGHYRQAADYHERALALYRDTDNKNGEALVLDSIGLIHVHQGRYQAAADHHRQAVELHREAGNRNGEACALNNLGFVEQALGHHEQAAQIYSHALELWRQTGDRSGEADALISLGSALLAVGQLNEARTSIAQALDLASQIGRTYLVARAHDGLGHSYRASGDAKLARDSWQQALTLFTELSAPEADKVRAQLSALGDGEP